MTAMHWLFIATIEATIVLALAGLLAAALWRASAAARHRAWAAGLAGVLAVFFAAALPGWRILPASDRAITPAKVTPPQTPAAAAQDVPIADAATDTVAQAATPPAQFSRPTVAPPLEFPTAGAAVAVAPVFAKSTPPQAASLRIPWNNLILAAWAIGALCASAPLLVGWWLFLRRARQWPPVDCTAAAFALNDAKSKMGIDQNVRLVESPACRVPMTFGLFRPYVALPAGCQHWPPERWQMVLAHELAHIRRRDVAFIWIGLFARAVAWFHPLTWITFRQLCIDAEKACDDAVLSAGAPPREYAVTLLEIAAAIGRKSPGNLPVVHMARRSALEKRVRSVLDAKRRRGGVSRHGVALVASFALLAGGLSILRAADSAGTPKDPPHNAGVFILGDLPDGTSAAYAIPGSNFRVLDALKLAKVDSAFAQGHTIVLVRHADPNRETRTAIPYAELAADPAKNLPLQDNDMLILQRGSLPIIPADSVAVGGRFFILGDATAPGEYDMNGQRLTVMEALTIAHFDHDGLSTHLVDLIRSKAGEQPVIIPVHIAAILAGTEPDRYIQDGDVINVETRADKIQRESPGPQPSIAPAETHQSIAINQVVPPASDKQPSGHYYVMGAISHPGEFDLHGQQILSALAAAGAESDLNFLSVTLIRHDTTGKPGRTEFHVADLLLNPIQDEPLQSADVLAVHHNTDLARGYLEDREVRLKDHEKQLEMLKQTHPGDDASEMQDDVDAEHNEVEGLRAQVEQWSRE